MQVEQEGLLDVAVGLKHFERGGTVLLVFAPFVYVLIARLRRHVGVMKLAREREGFFFLPPRARRPGCEVRGKDDAACRMPADRLQARFWVVATRPNLFLEP